jgi:hypothetical protein
MQTKSQKCHIIFSYDIIEVLLSLSWGLLSHSYCLQLAAESFMRDAKKMCDTSSATLSNNVVSYVVLVSTLSQRYFLTEDIFAHVYHPLHHGTVPDSQ